MPSLERDILTVSELNADVRALIEDNYSEIAVMGEISNFKRHSSGHLYMTLKDTGAQLRTVCFRSDAASIAFTIEDGLKVVARGRLTLYEPYGQYQLVAHAIEKAGVGELELAFRALCETLEREGLFDEEHKKPLPAYPFRIAVITSPTGAAVRDIVSTLNRRWPCVEVFLLPVHVQGPQAVSEIVEALERVTTIDRIDIVIVGRGGGSLEDLWAFNEEAVARAIFACPVPVVSAVGHETDFTIADFVADVRAATPTMAAEIAVPLMDEVAARIEEKNRRLVSIMEGEMELYSSRLQELLRSYGLGRIRGLIERHMQTLDYRLERLTRAMRDAVERRGNRLREHLAALRSLDPQAVLDRGFALCTDMATGRVVSSAETALQTGRMRVTFHDGRVVAKVEEKDDGKEEG